MCIIYIAFLSMSHYIVSSLACLDEINEKINCEDSRTRPLRRALIFMDILNKVNDH